MINKEDRNIAKYKEVYGAGWSKYYNRYRKLTMPMMAINV